MRTFSYWIVKALPLADAVTIAVLMVLMTDWRLVSGRPDVMLVLLLTVPVTQAFLAGCGVYDSHRLEGRLELARKVAVAHVMAGGILLGASLLLASPEVLRDHVTVLGCSLVLLATGKSVVYFVLRHLRLRGFDRRRVLFLGSEAQAERFAAELVAHPEWGLQIECVSQPGRAGRAFRAFPGGELAGESVEDVLKSRIVDEVLISADAVSLPGALEEARLFQHYGLMARVMIEPSSDAGASAPRLDTFVGAPSLAMAPAPRSERDLAIKRTVDVIVSALLLVLLAPLLVFIAVTIKLTSPGPLLFLQTRVGMNGRRFRMLKFRTMVDGAEFLVRQASRSITQGPIFKDPQDYRITTTGRVLRKFSLDELPQLWNVLRGDMSLVGPRPLPVYEAEKVDGAYRRRFSVPAGLTCIWQISGRSDITYDTWMQYDLQYVDRWSLWSDTKLILRTIPVVLTGRGGY